METNLEHSDVDTTLMCKPFERVLFFFHSKDAVPGVQVLGFAEEGLA